MINKLFYIILKLLKKAENEGIVFGEISVKNPETLIFYD